MWLSLVERCVRDAEAAGSNPVISTISSVHNGFELWTLDFYLYKTKAPLVSGAVTVGD